MKIKKRDSDKTNKIQLKPSININPLNSVGAKLFVYIVVGILACVMTMGYLAYQQSKAIIENKVSESTSQTITQLGTNLDNILKAYEDFTLQLMFDTDYHNYVELIADSGEDDFQKYQATRDLSSKLQSMIFGNDQIVGVSLIPVNNEMTTITVGSSQLNRANEQKNEPWFQTVMDGAGKAMWMDTRINGMTTNNASPSFSIARLMRNSTTSIAHYVLLLEVSISGIVNELDKVSLGDGSQIVIVNDSNQIMAHADRDLLESNAPFTINESDQEVSEKQVEGVGHSLFIHKQLSFNDWYLVGYIPVNELVKDAEVISKLTVTISIIAGLIAIAIALIVIWTISRPLNKITNLMQEGAKGNLTVRSTINKRKDEIGQLSNSFDEMMIQITQLATQTKQSAEDVLKSATTLTDASQRTAISAKEIAVATEEIANGSTSLAVEAERGNDITLLINDQMKQVLSANEEMTQSAHEVEEASGKGTAYMAELIEKTGMTEEMTSEMVQKVDSLKESTHSIVKILDVLNAITKQTNILSLNATIEASRAGNAGRGFMVVANEIRELADQSTHSIEVVAQITDKIQNEIAETVNVLVKAHPLFKEQINSVKEANTIFESVQSQMNGLVHKLDDVTNSINKLEASQLVLNEAMSNVSAVAEQSSATSEEVASLSSEQLSVSDNLVILSKELSKVSEVLNESLAKFKVN